MLESLLQSGGIPTIGRHWSDTTFVQLRRLMGLRLELMVLTIAEVVALRYYRALAEGGDDALLVDVSERILDDEYHHVPFQCHRLRVGFAHTSAPVRMAVVQGWRVLARAVAVVVAFDHGSALRATGVTRRASSPTPCGCSTVPPQRCSRPVRPPRASGHRARPAISDAHRPGSMPLRTCRRTDIGRTITRHASRPGADRPSPNPLPAPSHDRPTELYCAALSFPGRPGRCGPARCR